VPAGVQPFSSARSSSVIALGVDVEVISDDATLYILYGESLVKYTGRCQHDFSVQGYDRLGPQPLRSGRVCGPLRLIPAAGIYRASPEKYLPETTLNMRTLARES
jgi:hypothetical protein